MEYLDLYDANKNLTGDIILRSKDMKIPPGKYINIVIIFIENSEGKFLIQKTSKEKKSVYATTGGHVKSKSDSLTTAVEEIKEELGIEILKDELEYITTKLFEFAILDVYYIKKDIDISDLKLQDEEVENVYWLSIDEINKLIENNEFRKGNIEPFKYLIEKKDLK